VLLKLVRWCWAKNVRYLFYQAETEIKEHVALTEVCFPHTTIE